MQYTFPPEKRIRKSVDYKRLFTTGKRLNGKHCRIYARVEDGERQMGVVISRMIKGSVIRNRHKRLVREFFRLNQYKLTESIKLVIFVSTCFQPDKYEIIENEISELVFNSGIFVKKG